MISPHNDEQGWNTITLVDHVSPGVVTLSGHDRKPKWDIQAASGQKGATMALTSPSEPGAFDADFYLADQDEFDAWDSFQALIESSIAVDPPTGLDIYHPRPDGKGGGRIKVHFKEHLPKTEAPTKTASGSKSGGVSGGAAGAASGATGNSGGGAGSPTDPNDPIAAAAAELDALIDEGNNL
jgi:hypothetical protein